MSEPFIGQIQAFGFNFPPRGWGNCDGTLIAISQNQALFALLGTIYGGDGRTNFALPDLRGRSALHFGRGPGLRDYRQGVRGGTETNTMTTAQMPSHNHQGPLHNHELRATTQPADSLSPASTRVLARTATVDIYATAGRTMVSMSNTAPNQAITEAGAGPTSNTGGGQAFNNLPPFLVIEMSIALQGIFPSRN